MEADLCCGNGYQRPMKIEKKIRYDNNWRGRVRVRSQTCFWVDRKRWIERNTIRRIRRRHKRSVTFGRRNNSHRIHLACYFSSRAQWLRKFRVPDTLCTSWKQRDRTRTLHRGDPIIRFCRGAAQHSTARWEDTVRDLFNGSSGFPNRAYFDGRFQPLSEIHPFKTVDTRISLNLF